MRVDVILASLEGCTAELLDDADALEAALLAAVRAGGFTLLHRHVHRFSPQGVTAAAVLGESHINLHSWPEEGRLFVDIATCSGPEATRAAFAALCAAIAHTEVSVQQTSIGGSADLSPPAEAADRSARAAGGARPH